MRVPHRIDVHQHVARCPVTAAIPPADILASFQRFYFDTALSSNPVALPRRENIGSHDLSARPDALESRFAIDRLIWLSV